MANAILILIKSKNPPVFPVPLPIWFDELPVVGQSFLFKERCGGSGGNTSMVEKITFEKGTYKIKTRNSLYELIP